MLQIFDDGRLTDSKGKTVDFKNTLIILTSNIGSDIILNNTLETMVSGTDSDKLKEDVMALMRERFKPEFLNRIDETVFFKALNMAQLKDIVDIQVAQLDKLLAERDITLEMSDDAKEFLASKGFNPIYGARPLKRTIRQLIENPLSKKILTQEVKEHSHLFVDVKDDEITFEEKDE